MRSGKNRQAGLRILPSIAAAAMLRSGCLGAVQDLYPEEQALRPVTLYVMSHGWHVGIAFESGYIRHKIPSHEKLPKAKYLKFGWGDAAYYPHEDPGIWLLLRAA